MSKQHTHFPDAAHYVCFVARVIQAVGILVQTPIQHISDKFVAQYGTRKFQGRDFYTSMILRVFTLAMTALKVQQAASTSWKQQRMCESADNETASGSGTSGDHSPPDWYMAGTAAIAGIAQALALPAIYIGYHPHGIPVVCLHGKPDIPSWYILVYYSTGGGFHGIAWMPPWYTHVATMVVTVESQGGTAQHHRGACAYQTGIPRMTTVVPAVATLVRPHIKMVVLINHMVKLQYVPGIYPRR